MCEEGSIRQRALHDLLAWIYRYPKDPMVPFLVEKLGIETVVDGVNFNIANAMQIRDEIQRDFEERENTPRVIEFSKKPS